MSNQHTSESRENVLEVVRKTPNIAAGDIAWEIGLSTGRVLKILAELRIEGSISWRILPPEAGVSRSPRRAYFVDAHQGPKIPAAWDVLAHFFGRIAEPELEAA